MMNRNGMVRTGQRKWLVLAALALGLVTLAAFLFATQSAAAPFRQGSPTPERPVRMPPPPARSPELNYQFPPSPTCYNPVRGTGACYIRWDYFYYEAASSQYILTMTITIDDKIRAYHSGFFQTYLYINDRYYGKGFEVSCGRQGAAGEPGMGAEYGYIFQARETGGVSSYDAGKVLCPADEAHVYLPAVIR
jgi:hypothetical protein